MAIRNESGSSSAGDHAWYYGFFVKRPEMSLTG
jgi:hypothetical protein